MGSIPLAANNLRIPPPADPLQQVGQVIGFRSMMANQQAQQQEQQLRGQEIQKGQIQLSDQQAMTTALHQWDGKDLNDLPGLILKNGGSANAVFSTRASVVKQQQDLANLSKDQLANEKTRNDYFAQSIDNVKQLPADQQAEAFDLAKADAVKQGHLDPQRAQTLQYQGPEQLDLLEKSLLGHSAAIDAASKTQDIREKASKLQAQAQWLTQNPGKTEADYEAAQAGAKSQAEESGKITAQQKAAGPGKAFGTTLDVQEANDWLTQNPGKTLSDYQKYEKTIPQVYQAGALQGQAMDLAAENYFQTGQLPAGMRSPAMSAQIINRAAQLHPNGTGDLAGNRAAYEANKKSYDNVTGTLDTLSAFEQSGLKNLKQFTDLASKLPDTGVPWLNTPVRLLNQNLVGAQYMPAIEAARSVALREIARVTNDPKLSGSLTDSARGEVSNFSPENATLPQIRHVVEVLQNDMANVHSSLAAQKADIGGRLGIKAQSAQAGGANAAPAQGTLSNFHVNPQTGARIGWDGSKWVPAPQQ